MLTQTRRRILTLVFLLISFAFLTVVVGSQPAHAAKPDAGSSAPTPAGELNPNAGVGRVNRMTLQMGNVFFYDGDTTDSDWKFTAVGLDCPASITYSPSQGGSRGGTAASWKLTYADKQQSGSGCGPENSKTLSQPSNWSQRQYMVFAGGSTDGKVISVKADLDSTFKKGGTYNGSTVYIQQGVDPYECPLVIRKNSAWVLIPLEKKDKEDDVSDQIRSLFAKELGVSDTSCGPTDNDDLGIFSQFGLPESYYDAGSEKDHYLKTDFGFSGSDVAGADLGEVMPIVVAGGIALNGPLKGGGYTSDGNDSSKSGNSDSTGEGTTCALDGVGWIICPVVHTIALFNDSLFKILESLLNVNASMFDTTSGGKSTFKSWQAMRDIANVAFVIAFMVIVYSQLTSAGISNYGIKKMLPRIVVAAILVNLSFVICAIAVDISNIVGHSLHDLLVSQTKKIGDHTGANLTIWDDLATGLLAGATGTIAVGGAVLAIGSYGFLGALALLIPLAVTALVAALTVVFVLVARQALVIILVVLSPLAFVAYLLPNTEQWFDRWRKTFFSMLLIYPFVSLLFGGSQLASAVIRSGADDALVFILSLVVLVVPLFATPILLKLSGGMIGRVAGMMNNPNKGPFDRMKKGGARFADRRRNAQFGSALSRTDAIRNGNGRGLGAAGSRRRRTAAWISGIGNANAIDNEQKDTYAKAGADSAKRNYVADRALEPGSDYAARVGGSPAAASYVKAYAVQAREEEFRKDVNAEKVLFEHEKRNFKDVGDAIKNGAYDSPDQEHIKHAAMEYYFSQANSDGVQDMINHVATLRQDATAENLESVQKLQQTAAKALDGHGLKPVDLSASNLTNMKNGEFAQGETQRVAETIGSGKINSGHIGKMDIDEMRRWNGQLADHPDLLKSLPPEKVQATYEAIIQAENDPRINVQFGDREKQALAQMKSHLESQWMNTQAAKDAQDSAASTYGPNI